MLVFWYLMHSFHILALCSKPAFQLFGPGLLRGDLPQRAKFSGALPLVNLVCDNHEFGLVCSLFCKWDSQIWVWLVQRWSVLWPKTVEFLASAWIQRTLPKHAHQCFGPGLLSGGLQVFQIFPKCIPMFWAWFVERWFAPWESTTPPAGKIDQEEAKSLDRVQRLVANTCNRGHDTVIGTEARDLGNPGVCASICDCMHIDGPEQSLLVAQSRSSDPEKKLSPPPVPTCQRTCGTKAQATESRCPSRKEAEG